jgi:hypothetical protein
VVKSRFIIIYEHGSRYVHGIDQHKPFLDPALSEAIFNLRRNIDKASP